MEYKRKVLPDVIKIICTLCILFHHYQQLTGTFFYRGINFYGGKFYFGYLVELFFIMSGWVMVSYIDRIKDNMTFPAFISKRLIRLLPSMIVSTVAYDILLFIFTKYCNGTIRYPQKIDIFGSIITSLGMGSWCITKDFEINTINWYVSVLLLCYIIFYILVFISKISKIPTSVLFAIPVIAGVIRTYGMEYSFLPFFSPRIARGYIHFFGGLLLGIIFISLFGHIKKKEKEENKTVITVKKVIGYISEATLDVYLLQLPVLLGFFIFSYYTNFKLVSGKTMLLFTAVTFLIGCLYHFLVGKRIYALLSGVLKKSGKAKNGAQKPI